MESNDRTDCTKLNKKCAEVFIQSEEIFYIECTFCFIQFTEFDKFTIHYVDEHMIRCIKPSKLSNSDSKNTDLDDDSSSYIINLEVFNYDENDNADNLQSNFELKKEIDDIKEGVIVNESNQLSVDLEVTNDREIKTKQIKVPSFTKQSSTSSKKRRRRSSQHFSCDICGKKFSYQKKLEDHKEHDHLPFNPLVNLTNSGNQSFHYSCTEESEDENESNTKQLQPTELDFKKCRYCDKKLTNKSSRIHHERVKHSGHRPFKCGKCDKLFATIFSQREHEKLHSEKQFKCNLCKATFTVKASLQSHLQRHYGEKLHPCSYCEKKFYNNAERKTHERTHTGEKPYQCISCGRCFTTSSHLLTHTRRFHETEFEKPHKCEVCNKSFLIKGMLRKHFVTHSELRPYECDICKKTFKLQHRLRLHKKIHSDERKYVCNICGNRFKQDVVLRSHMKSHKDAAIKKGITIE